MSRNQKLLVLAAVAAVFVVGGKYGAPLILAPIYAWLLASFVLLVLVGLAAVILPIGHKMVEKQEAAEAEEAEQAEEAGHRSHVA